MTTGEAIKKKRQELGWTQKELAEKSGIINSTIGKYERGVLHPKLGTLETIAAALGCEAFDLMPFDEYTKASMAQIHELEDSYLKRLNESARLLNHIGKLVLYKMALQMSYDPDYTSKEEIELLEAWAFLPEDVKKYGGETKER